MIALTAFLAAVTAVKIAWPLFGAGTGTRLAFVTVNVALAYWYWLPAGNILFVGYLGPETFVPDSQVAQEAVWVVLIYQVAAIAALAGMAVLFPERRDAGARAPLPTLGLGILALAGASVFLMWSFRTEGVDLWVQLLTGRTSARELVDYYNFSTSIEQSLRALLEVTVLFAALVVLSEAALQRHLGHAMPVFALTAIMLVVAATGTRSSLLMAVFVVALGRLGGHVLPSQGVGRRRAGFTLLAVFAVAVPIALAVSARTARSSVEDATLSMVLLNNDMFRELAYVKSQMSGYHGSDAIAFLLTPFTYLLPGFFGFSRRIPDHLLAFNGARANIDLILGSGNVFPGLIADNVLVFGAAGPLLFAMFLVVFTIALRTLGRIGGSLPGVAAAQVTVSAFLFFSFRNIHPALALVWCAAAVGLWLLGVVRGRSSVDTQSAYRA